MKISKRKLKIAEKRGLILNNEYKSVINLTVENSDSFFSKVYMKEPIITSEVSDVICNDKFAIRWSGGVHINIVSKENLDATTCKNAINEYFKSKYINTYRKHKVAYLVALMFLVLGVITFGLLFALSNSINLGLWEEVIDVVAWVFVWEACDIFVIQGIIDRQEHIIYRNLSKASVSIIEQNVASDKK